MADAHSQLRNKNRFQIQLPHLTSLKVGIDSPKGVDASVE